MAIALATLERDKNILTNYFTKTGSSCVLLLHFIVSGITKTYRFVGVKQLITVAFCALQFHAFGWQVQELISIDEDGLELKQTESIKLIETSATEETYLHLVSKQVEQVNDISYYQIEEIMQMWDNKTIDDDFLVKYYKTLGPGNQPNALRYLSTYTTRPVNHKLLKNLSNNYKNNDQHLKNTLFHIIKAINGSKKDCKNLLEYFQKNYPRNEKTLESGHEVEAFFYSALLLPDKAVGSIILNTLAEEKFFLPYATLNLPENDVALNTCRRNLKAYLMETPYRKWDSFFVNANNSLIIRNRFKTYLS